MLSGAAVPSAGRGRQLARLRSLAFEELRQDPRALPASIARRSMPWYVEAVLPLLLALGGYADAHRMVLDPEAEFDGVTAGAVIGQILLDVVPPTENGAA